jgi:rhodanese-related sulfurtransferase
MSFPVRSLSPDLLLAELALHTDACLWDVRTAEETRHQPGPSGAQPLDYLDSAFEARIDGLDRAAPHYFYCDTGKRSRLAAEAMAARGFILVAWVEGGITAIRQSTEA